MGSRTGISVLRKFSFFCAKIQSISPSVPAACETMSCEPPGMIVKLIFLPPAALTALTMPRVPSMESVVSASPWKVQIGRLR